MNELRCIKSVLTRSALWRLNESDLRFSRNCLLEPNLRRFLVHERTLEKGTRERRRERGRERRKERGQSGERDNNCRANGTFWNDNAIMGNREPEHVDESRWASVPASHNLQHVINFSDSGAQKSNQLIVRNETFPFPFPCSPSFPPLSFFPFFSFSFSRFLFFSASAVAGTYHQEREGLSAIPVEARRKEEKRSTDEFGTYFALIGALIWEKVSWGKRRGGREEMEKEREEGERKRRRRKKEAERFVYKCIDIENVVLRLWVFEYLQFWWLSWWEKEGGGEEMREERSRMWWI